MAYNPAQYYVGGGIFKLAEWDGTTPPDIGELAELGAVSSMELSPAIDKIEHETSRLGISAKDDEAVVKTGASMKIVVDQINQDVLSMFFLGDKVDTDEVELFTNTSQYYAVYFTCANTKGELWDFYVYKCSVTPSGAYKAISGKEYNTVELTLELLSDAVNHPTGSPFGKAIKMTAAG